METNKNVQHVAIKKDCHSRGMLSGIFHVLSRCRYKTGVIPNLIWNLLRLPLLFLNNLRGWSRIQYGMTPLFNNDGVAFISLLAYRLGVSPTEAASMPGNIIYKRGKLSGSHSTYKGCRGFTLIELLVVVLIIGILAAVALPQYQKAVYKARATEAVLMVNTLQKAVDLYILEHGWGNSWKVISEELDITMPSSECFGTPNVDYDYDSDTDEPYYSISLGGSGRCTEALWLVLEKRPDTAWSKTCNYSAGSPSESFCRDLEKQGWTFGIDW